MKREEMKSNETVKRGPGRPRKNPVDGQVSAEKKKPGRPKKDPKITRSGKEVKVDPKLPSYADAEDTPNTDLTVSGLASISKAVKESMVHVTRNEARFLVDTYYQVQNKRITAANQIRAITQQSDDQGESIPLALKWVFEDMANQEAQIKVMLDHYTSSNPVGKWMKDVIGIGPVLAAGVMSYFDINKVQHYGQFWSFAGLNDYNNPWLGVDKAGKMVKEIYGELEEADIGVTEAIKEFCEDADVDFKKVSEKITKDLKPLKKEKNYGFDQISQRLTAKGQDIYTFLMEQYGDPDWVNDYIIRTFIDPKAVTDRVIDLTCVRTNRRRAVVVNGLNNAIKNRKETKPNCTATDLKAYLSKPPYSLDAKQLVYLIGESFVKVSGKENSLYGRLYKERKAYETQQNENKAYAEQAAKSLEEKNYSKDTESYKAYAEGKLPPLQIHRRSKRFAVKIFLSHVYEAMYIEKYGKKMEEEIYPIAHLGHTDYIGPEVPFDKYLNYEH